MYIHTSVFVSFETITTRPVLHRVCWPYTIFNKVWGLLAKKHKTMKQSGLVLGSSTGSSTINAYTWTSTWVRWSKRLGCRQEVCRFRTRGESKQSLAQGRWSIQEIHLGFERHQKLKMGVSVALQKGNQKFEARVCAATSPPWFHRILTMLLDTV